MSGYRTSSPRSYFNPLRQRRTCSKFPPRRILHRRMFHLRQHKRPCPC